MLLVFEKLKLVEVAVVDLLIGDGSKAKKKFDWDPQTKFKALIELMTDADVRLIKDQQGGKPILSY